MAVKQPRLGMRHVTVVPTNFVPDDDETDGDEAASVEHLLEGAVQ